MKSLGSNVDLNYDSKLEKGRCIIDAKPSVTIATTKVQLKKLKEPEEGE
jgi:flagellar biosynthesis/type III secretory pathway protein FliH